MSEFMVLGFMGESGHGKDFCGEWLVKEKGFVRVAFADVLKRFAKEVFYFTDEALWGSQEERNRLITPWKVGREGWTIASFRFVQRVRAWVHGIHNLSPEDQATYVATLIDWFNCCFELARQNNDEISARVALQLLGTEYGRHFKDIIWPEYLHKVIIPRIKQGEVYTKEVGLMGIVGKAPPGVIITDHRFRNEVEYTQSQGGHVIKVVRLAKKGQPNEAEKFGISGHASEAELRGIPNSAYDLVLEMEDGADNVYPRLEKMYQEKEWLTK